MPTGFSLGTAYATIEIDSSGVKDGMNNAKKSVTSGLKNIGESMASVGKSTMLLTAPLLAFGAAAVTAFAESEKVTAQLDAVLKSTGQTAGVTRDMALDLAAGFQQVTMFEDDAVLSGENMLLTFTNIGKDVFPEATKTMLDMSQALGQDLQSSAIQLGKALNDPINGITALQRVGVTFTDSQKATIEQMVKMGDVAGAQKIILAELQREFGGSAVAAGQTFAGQLVILQNKLGDVMETIGGALVPILQDMLAKITPIIDAVAQWITKNPELVTQIGMAVVAAFAFGAILTVVGTAVTVLSGAIAFLLSPVGLLIAGIVAIVYAASQLYPGGLMKLFNDAAAAARQLAILGLGFLSMAADWARQRLAELLNTILQVISKIDELKNRLSAGVTGLGGIIGGVANGQFSIQQVLDAVGAEINGGRAYGGSVQAGMPYTVGERGAETFVPQVNGSIVPAGAGGGGMVVNVQGIYANTEAGGRAAARGFAEELEDLFRGRGNQ